MSLFPSRVLQFPTDGVGAPGQVLPQRGNNNKYFKFRTIEWSPEEGIEVGVINEGKVYIGEILFNIITVY